MTDIVLYGLKSARDAYRIVRYKRMHVEKMSINDIKYEAANFAMENGGIDRVYAVDNSYQLVGLYRETIRKNSMEANVIFKTYLSQVGIRAW